MIPLSRETSENIVTLLLVKGRLTNEQVDIVTKDESEGTANGSVLAGLLEKEYCSEQDVADSISESYGLPGVTLTTDNLDKVAANLLPKNFLQVNHVLPFAIDDGTLKVALADPSKLTVVPSLRSITKFTNIDIYVTTFSNLVESLYWLGITAVAPPTDEFVAAAPKEDAIKIKSDEPSSDVIDFVNQVIREAISKKASDIHVERGGSAARVRFRIDGVLYNQNRFSDFLDEQYNAISTRLKIMCNANISERRLPQDGAIPFDQEKGIDLRVNFLPTHGGAERVVMRILNKKGLSVKLDQLGLHEKNGLPKLLSAVNSPQGMVLITGPTGSGKTTTLYSLLSLINKEGINILTAEDPVEYALDGIGQVQVRDDIGFGFASALRAFLRQDPEVILIGEIRDKDTVEIAVKAALTGHLVFSTLHTNDSPSSITRLIDMGIPPYLVASAVSLVMAQRLARKNCSHCSKVEEEISVEQLVSLGFSESEASAVKPKKGKGCGKCGKTGYGGRQGIYEILKITSPLRDVIQNGADMQAIVSAARQDGFMTLAETGRMLLQDGALSIEEYQRVLVTG